MITKPTLLIDETKCRNNIKMMADKAKRHQIEFRPHFKTHQSLEIGQWFRNEGVKKITVSSLDMASYFSKDWNDITVAFPVNILEIDTINQLASRITLNILIESTAVVDMLTERLLYPVNFYIKINVGNDRAGLNPSNTEAVQAILNQTQDNQKLMFKGFLGHAGQTYKCRNHNDILNEHEKSKAILFELKQQFINQYPDLKLSLGDTPSCSISEDFSGIDEIRPGNFAFYDLTQTLISSCDPSQIAVAMACPIVAIHDDIEEIVVNGGGIHFSKDRMTTSEGLLSFGHVVHKTESGWGDLIPEMNVRSLSQEHGIVSVPKEQIRNYTIGDYLIILPVHSCMAADLMKQYMTIDGKLISMFNSHIA